MYLMSMVPSSSLLLGDCLTFMGSCVTDGEFNHVITDPPYGMNVHKNQFGPEGGIKATKRMLDFAPLTEAQMYQYAKEMVRVSRGWVLVFCQSEMLGDWKRALLAAGAKYQRGCVWVKEGSRPQLSGDRPGQGCEMIAAAWAGKGRSVWNGHGKLGIYYASIPRGRDRIHPTQKPLSLMEELVLDFTAPDDLIFDPFCGVATTGVAALLWGRRFCGVEMEKAYFDAAHSRLSSLPRCPPTATLDMLSSSLKKTDALSASLPEQPPDGAAPPLGAARPLVG
jgi:site-specific DNA-methyltransferase (adenine-specific)